MKRISQRNRQRPISYNKRLFRCSGRIESDDYKLSKSEIFLTRNSSVNSKDNLVSSGSTRKEEARIEKRIRRAMERFSNSVFDDMGLVVEEISEDLERIFEEEG